MFSGVLVLYSGPTCAWLAWSPRGFMRPPNIWRTISCGGRAAALPYGGAEAAAKKLLLWFTERAVNICPEKSDRLSRKGLLICSLIWIRPWWKPIGVSSSSDVRGGGGKGKGRWFEGGGLREVV